MKTYHCLRRSNRNLELSSHSIITNTDDPGVRCESAAARLLGLRVGIPLGAWMSVSWQCCVLSGREICVGLITRPEVSYQLRCV
jgi:hypothetical protein